MHISLVRELIDKGVIRNQTEVDASYRGVDLSGMERLEFSGLFSITNIYQNQDMVMFEVADLIDGRKRLVGCDDLLKIDGMEPNRIARVYGLTASGEKLAQGKRRGRKRNSELNTIMEHKFEPCIDFDDDLDDIWG